MQSVPTVGIDLPVQALISDEADGKTSISYNDPQYVIRRHGLDVALVANLAAVRPFIEHAAAE